MPDQNDNQQPKSNQKANTNLFMGGMKKDIDPRFLQQGQYLHAINATLNSLKGDMYKIGNEPSNIQCAKIPYQMIGSIPLKLHRFAICSTDNTNSEIGIFDATNCSYTKVVNDPGLNFHTNNLVIGVSKENYDCTESIYFNDGNRNPARALNVDQVPYIKKELKNAGEACSLFIDTDKVDIEALRLTPLISVPNIDLVKAHGGALPNGAYRIAIAYTVKEVRITDYLQVSAPIFFYHPSGVGGAFNVQLTNLDQGQTEYELILISTVNQQTSARQLGFYSTQQSSIHVDQLKEDSIIVALSDIPLQNEYFEGGDAMFKVNQYLIQTGVKTRPEFNYLKQARKIQAHWVGYAVPDNYYHNGGTKIGYTKGEVIALFIRFVWNTGHRTQSFPLFGREAATDEKSRVINKDSLGFATDGSPVEKWQIYDTATLLKTYAPENGEHTAFEGEFGYYESKETYPNNPEVYGDDACKPYRLFRWPEQELCPNYDPVRKKMIILGLKLDNVTYPLDEKGNPIPGIVGYEILRGDKLGNKTIMAKGLIYNMGEFDPIDSFSNQKGLYANYPYNDLRTDPYLTKKMVDGGCQGNHYQSMGTFKNDFFTFHSPETSFSNPSLGSYLKVEAEVSGTMNGQFTPVYQHPRHKVIRDFAFFVSAALGIGEGVLAIKGKTTYTGYPTIVETDATFLGTGAKVYKPIPTISSLIAGSLTQGAIASLLGGNLLKRASTHGQTLEETAASSMPAPLRIANSIVLFTFYFGQGTSKTLDIIKQLIPYEQHAYQCNSVGLYTNYSTPSTGNQVRSILDSSYLHPHNQDFQGFKVNNYLRESAVLLRVNDGIAPPKVVDTSRQTIGTLRAWSNPTTKFSQDISAYYVSIRNDIESPYGQLEGVNLVPTSSLVYPIDTSGKTSSGLIFGGDTIIEEFTLKRKMHYFSQTQVGTLQDGYQFDYRLYPNLPYPRYWMDTTEYDLSQFFNITNIKLPNDLHYFDRSRTDCTSKVSFRIHEGYMYLYNAGVVRFYVESAYNLPYRKNSSTVPAEKSYDKYFNTDVNSLLRSDVIGQDNFFDIDRSLSPERQLTLTYGSVIPRDFSVITQKCFSYEPNKLIYSLPSNLEGKRDTWRNFLTNNVYLFPKDQGRLSSIKEVSRNGAMYLFDNAPAQLHPGVDEIQLNSGKVTIGDGGLFARPLQSISNSDFDLTSCQSTRGVVSTQYGVFFLSQEQGKVFQYTGIAQDISNGIKWWLAEFMPSRLLKQFPNFELPDNPVSGVGCQIVFDNTSEILYITKKDYQLKPDVSASYLDGTTFKSGTITFELGDPRFFDDASWTLSYDPKTRTWVSYHDWHPDWIIQHVDHFYTFKDTYIWKHNQTSDSFCNFYGVDYPFHVEFPYANPQEVTTLESVEYYLECYKYFGTDPYHLWDFNFDRAIVYNSEQCTGILRLNMRQPNFPSLVLEYPKYTGSGVEIECVKVQQKYRFNQIKDLTTNRGQFDLNYRQIWVTEPNGYQKSLNLANINYNKPAAQRKKMRHNVNIIILRRNICGDTKMMLHLFNTKQDASIA